MISSGRECVAAIDASVVGVTHPCRDHVCVEFVAQRFPPSWPGQFLQVRCGPALENPPSELQWPAGALPTPRSPDWNAHLAYTRRPFSIADRWEASDGAHMTIISRAIGPGTRWLDHLAAGNVLNVTGPLGRGFVLPEPARPLVLVGGGVGIPPLLYLCRALAERAWPVAALVLGALRADLLPVPLRATPRSDGRPSLCAALPASAQIPASVTTDDGSAGMRGRTTDALAAILRDDSRFSGAVVLACGPEPMLEAVARVTRAAGVDCQLCIERTMGCGLGTCLSCVVRVRDTRRAGGWRWALSCTEGPVFERDALVDDHEALGSVPVAAQ